MLAFRPAPRVHRDEQRKPTPEIQTLYNIADAIWTEPKLNSRDSRRTPTPHDAKSLVRLVSTKSLIATEKRSHHIDSLLAFYRDCKAWDFDPERNWDVLNSKLRSFMSLIDKLFFFSTLTRKVRGAPIVSLRIIDSHSPKLYGVYYPSRREIHVFLVKKFGERYKFDHLLHTLAHEMCHAFLDLFADRRHREHHERVEAADGHGSMFRALLRFVAETVYDLTGSRTWARNANVEKKKGRKEKDDCFEEEGECITGNCRGDRFRGPPGFPVAWLDDMLIRRPPPRGIPISFHPFPSPSPHPFPPPRRLPPYPLPLPPRDNRGRFVLEGRGRYGHPPPPPPRFFDYPDRRFSR